jgi:hypothetical protein
MEFKEDFKGKGDLDSAGSQLDLISLLQSNFYRSTMTTKNALCAGNRE